MDKVVFLYPEGGSYTVQELAKRLQFRYLVANAYETPSKGVEIQERGFQKFTSGEVSTASIESGQKFKQQIQAHDFADVSVHFINEAVGHGLFAEEDLLEGAFVGEYIGIVRENNRRYTEPLNNYCYEYPVLDSVGRSFVIDATQGNLTRFMNHSFQPNVKSHYAYLDGKYHCIFLALHPIAKGTQLLYDYGQNYWYARTPPHEF